MEQTSQSVRRTLQSVKWSATLSVSSNRLRTRSPHGTPGFPPRARPERERRDRSGRNRYGVRHRSGRAFAHQGQPTEHRAHLVEVFETQRIETSACERRQQILHLDQPEVAMGEVLAQMRYISENTVASRTCAKRPRE